MAERDRLAAELERVRMSTAVREASHDEEVRQLRAAAASSERERLIPRAVDVPPGAVFRVEGCSENQDFNGDYREHGHINGVPMYINASGKVIFPVFHLLGGNGNALSSTQVNFSQTSRGREIVTVYIRWVWARWWARHIGMDCWTFSVYHPDKCKQTSIYTDSPMPPKTGWKRFGSNERTQLRLVYYVDPGPHEYHITRLIDDPAF
jgi:hypothetical protein